MQPYNSNRPNKLLPLLPLAGHILSLPSFLHQISFSHSLFLSLFFSLSNAFIDTPSLLSFALLVMIYSLSIEFIIRLLFITFRRYSSTDTTETVFSFLISSFSPLLVLSCLIPPCPIPPYFIFHLIFHCTAVITSSTTLHNYHDSLLLLHCHLLIKDTVYFITTERTSLLSTVSPFFFSNINRYQNLLEY